MRTRRVVAGSADYTVAALTLDQIEHLIAPIEQIKGKPKISARKLICSGLNNALHDGEPRWTEERVDALDSTVFEALQNAVLEMSGLTGKKVREEMLVS